MNKRKTEKPAIKRNPRSPGSLDAHFGEKLRARRRIMVPTLSQTELAKALGITFQQVQKYEKGRNRMSAATMVRIAELLEVDIQYFFDDLPTGINNNKAIKTPILIDMSLAAHGPRMIDAFLKSKSDKLRGAITDLAQTLAQNRLI